MKRKCIFCSIPKTDEKERIVFENERLYVIEDIRPCASQHFLVIPKQHIYDCNSLTHADFDLYLVEEMETVGLRVLQQHGVTDNIRCGFHRRPWHTIGHLHLHCIGLPFKNCFSKFSHSPPFFVSIYKVKRWIQ